ncbi:MAG: hypothetical protein AB7M05_08685 [Alphaproteobacteria bacterium]
MVLLLGAFLSGTSVEAVMAAMPMDQPCDMAMDMGGSGDGVPCSQRDAMPACAPFVGCPTFVGLPAPDLSAFTLFRWSSAWYGRDLVSLVGRSIKPDLFPPILA